MKKTLALLSATSVALLSFSCTPPEYGELTSAAAPNLKGNYPIAHPTDKKDHVISPFAPHNILDVSGMKPGHIAQDPTTAAIDPTTKKVIPGSAKTFRIPLPKKRAAKPAQEATKKQNS